MKDLGCTQEETLDLLLQHWNDACEPPWEVDELADKVAHAFRYGKEVPGSAAPEAVFHEPPPLSRDEQVRAKQHPFAELNREFAFVKAGGFVLQETTDPKGNFRTEHLSMSEFHGWFANKPWQTGNQKPKPISQHWMEWANRRQYEGLVFLPEKVCDPRWYNLWRGFTVAPAEKAKSSSLDLFLEHALKNVCRGNKELFTWLMGYFAHMIQRPWEKPLVALVFKGRKGTGKNALVERVGYLLGAHFLVADDDRYLLSNFNSHLEANLFFCLDEATWAGDKKAEGRLKGLITGQFHNIERKGKEPYQVDNLTRVAILGNEDWLVPVSQDERRFAIFHVGDGRKQDRKFFEDMRVGMENGGYAHLLRYLMDFDLSQVDVNDAPQTQALMDQKIASLEPVHMWWFDCLCNGQIGDWAGDWPTSTNTNRLRLAFNQWARTRAVKCRQSDRVFISELQKCASITHKRIGASKKELGDSNYVYLNPGLAALRKEWDEFIGGANPWLE